MGLIEDIVSELEREVEARDAQKAKEEGYLKIVAERFDGLAKEFISVSDRMPYGRWVEGTGNEWHFCLRDEFGIKIQDFAVLEGGSWVLLRDENLLGRKQEHDSSGTLDRKILRYGAEEPSVEAGIACVENAFSRGMRAFFLLPHTHE